VSLLAVAPSLELVAAVINFGALIAFTFVNLAVIAHYAVHRGRFRTAPDFARYVALPLIGAGLTGILWTYLSADALITGLVWTALGVLHLAVLTRGFHRRLGSLDGTMSTQPVSETEPSATGKP